MKVEQIILHPDELRALRLCKKKRRVTCRDVDWFILAGMVRKSVIDKVISMEGKERGWAYFKISKRGRRFLDVKMKREQESSGHNRGR